MFRSRPRGIWPFAAAAVLIIPFTVPVPWLTNAIWTHMPGWFVTIENIWPMQRLFLVWSSLILFTAAIALGAPGPVPDVGVRRAILRLLLCGLAWSGYEAYEMAKGTFVHRQSPAETRLRESPDNLELSRYAYSSFSYCPSYFSHAFMDPWFENRLLDVHSLEPIITNADAAAPSPTSPEAEGPSPRLEQAGVWTGDSVTSSNYYLLEPRLSFEPGKHYALRLEFTTPGISGTLQLRSRNLFREYMLPDSGSGMPRAGSSHAFGSDDTSCHVMPISISGADDAPPSFLFIANKRIGDKITFARYWLYSYDRDRLPVSVESWIPYTARVDTPRPAFLETPRMYLRGWRARVNGHWATPLQSPDNLVMIPLNAGTSRVILEYFAPLPLTLAFWACALGWTALAAVAACQLFLWSGAMTLDFAWVSTPSWLLRIIDARGYPFALAWHHKTATSCAVVACILAAVYVKHQSDEKYDLQAVGPVRVEFTRPHGFIGASQPILTTGRATAATIVFVTYLDEGHATIGADVWGTLFKSPPLAMDFGKVQSLVVSDSALFPLKNPSVKGLQPSEIARLRNEIAVELNGTPVIQGAAYAYETTPAEVLAGSAPFGSTTNHKFMGQILSVERLPVPREVALPSGRHAHLHVVFPKGRIGRNEPILSATSGIQSRLCYVSYLDYGKLRMTCWGPEGVPAMSVEVEYDPKTAHDLDFIPGESSYGPASFDMACEFDGAHVLGHAGNPPAEPPVIESGRNTLRAPDVDARFTGPVMDLELKPNTNKASEAAEEFGPIHLVVNFPAHKEGRSEPLVSAGHTGAGDFVYVNYVDDRHVRLGFDHWGYGGEISAPIAVNYSAPHEIWVSMAPLYPGEQDDRSWRGLDRAARRRLRSRVEVVLDGKSALTVEAPTYPSLPSEIAVARNPIGGSTSDPVFSGTLVFAERGAEIPAPH
jgi:hypothetical protein